MLECDDQITTSMTQNVGMCCWYLSATWDCGPRLLNILFYGDIYCELIFAVRTDLGWKKKYICNQYSTYAASGTLPTSKK
jgi:hypothetical protein